MFDFALKFKSYVKLLLMQELMLWMSACMFWFTKTSGEKKVAHVSVIWRNSAALVNNFLQGTLERVNQNSQKHG